MKFSYVIVLVHLFIATKTQASSILEFSDQDIVFQLKLLPTGVTIQSLFDRKTNIELTNLASNSRLFDIDFKDQDGNLKTLYGNGGWHSTEGKKFSGASGVITQEADFAGKTLRAEVNVNIRSGKVHLRFTISPPKNISLQSLRAAPLFIGPLGKGEDDFIHYPNGSGIVEPAAYDTDNSYTLKYPTGRQSYQLIGLYDKTTGFVFMSQDPRGGKKSLQFAYYKQSGIRFSAEYYAPQDFSFDTVFGVQRGDWYDAALYYRAFVSKEARWWPERDAIFWQKKSKFADTAFWLAVVGKPSNVVNKALEIREQLGVPIGVHWYTWNVWGMDDNYPNLFPPHPGFAEAVQALQKHQITVMPYATARLWDMDLENFSSDSIKAGVKTQALELLKVQSPKVTFAVMCPAADFWQDTIAEGFRRLFSELKVDGVYVDETAAASPSLCFDPTHEHVAGSPYAWVDGYHEMFRKVRPQVEEKHFFTSEMNAEPYMDLFEGYLNWWWVFPNQKPIYQAIYGGQYLSFGRSHAEDSELAVATKSAQQLVFGEQIGWFFGDPRKLFPKSFDFLADLARSRYELREYFSGGHMLRPLLDPPDLPSVDTQWYWRQMQGIRLPAILNSVWQSADGRKVYLFVNISEQNVGTAFKLNDGEISPSFSKRIDTKQAEYAWRQQQLTLTMKPFSILGLEQH